MIEKIMRAVKSSNKKRGRNITIGTVVGMLLSCTTVIRADDYLWIKNDGGIKFSKNNGTAWEDKNPYSNNSWDGSTYTNNITLSGNNNGADDVGVNIGYGLKLDVSGIKINLVNNGVIKGFGEDSFSISGEGSGIKIETMEGNITNSGTVIGYSNASASGEGSGIKIETMKGNITNSGTIIGYVSASASGEGSGIKIETMEGNITNSGTIIGYVSVAVSGEGSGIKIETMEGNITNSGTIIGYDDDASGEGSGIKIETMEGNITNSGTIIGYGYVSASGEGSGIKIETMEGNITNKGVITGYGRGYGSGTDSFDIDSSSSGVKLKTMEGNITNKGVITGDGRGYGSGSASFDIDSAGYGIRIKDMKGNITNSGVITGNGYGDGRGTGSFDIDIAGYGIKIKDMKGNITNSGAIKGYNNGQASGSGSFDLDGYGIKIKDMKGNITNSGAITGSGDGTGFTGSTSNGYGIYIESSSTEASNIINSGVIFGTTNAIKIDGGTINPLKNSGILITDGSSIINNSGTISTQNNYGLQIKNGGASAGDITAGNPGNSPIDIIVGYDADGKPLTREMTIKNNQAIDGSGSFTGNDYDNSILNALKNTYKVTDAEDKITGSIINAYENAIVFNDTDKQLTLLGTIVSGGIKDGTYAIKGIDGSSVTLILEGTEIEYKDIDNRFQQTIINGNIHMGSGDNNITLKNGSVINGNITTGTGADIVTIENGAQINGTLTGGVGGESNILNFKTTSTTKTALANDDEIRIMHNISGFENINVETNATFYEKTVSTSGAMGGLKITGVESLTIGANGVLTLRIDTTNDANTHALSTGNAGGTIYSKNGGKLLLALNGAGNNSIISFGGTDLNESLVTAHETENEEKINFASTSSLHTIKRVKGKTDEVRVILNWNLPDYLKYTQLNKIYQSIVSVNDLISNFNVDDDEKLSTFLSYLNDIYAGNPYSYSSELSRKSMGMFRDIVTENSFKPNLNNWLIYGGLTHTDGGTKDTYYGKGYYTYDIGSSNIEADSKITGAYMLGEYGVSDTLTSGIIIGGNKLKSNISNGSKIDGAALYLGAYAKKYLGNLKVTGGVGFQYGDYDADRLGVNKVASVSEKSVIKYSDNYNDMTYDIYLNGRYSNPIGENLFLEPYATLSYTYIKQDGANEGSKTLAIETDSKSFDYTVGKVGLDLKKIIPHSAGKSILTAGISYTKILDGAEEEHITGRFKGGSDFDILVAHKNQHSIGLNAKYALELESGILFDVKGTYSVERDSHNNSGKNRTKGEWIVGTGLGYKF